MSFTGNFEAWAEFFPIECLPIVFKLILEEWPEFSRPTSERKLENRITHRFVGHLQRKVRGAYPFSFRFRTKLVDAEADAESGELDIEVFTGLNIDVYFAFECKRLHTAPGHSRVSEYIGAGGMGCFLTGQYGGSAGCGGMIGYIMDNDVSGARDAVDAAIQREIGRLQLRPPERLHSTEICPEEGRLMQTKHLVKRNDFVIYHLLLPLLPENGRN